MLIFKNILSWFGTSYQVT